MKFAYEFLNKFLYPLFYKHFYGELKIDSTGISLAGGLNGGKFSLTVTNVGLRTITIKKIFFVVTIKDENFLVPLIKYKNLFEIEPNQTKVIDGEEFTEIQPNIEFIDYIREFNFGFQEPSGKIIWTKQFGKCDSKLLDDVYKKNNFVASTIVRKEYRNKVLPQGVKRVVQLRYLNHFDEVKEGTFFVYESGAIFDETGKNVRYMTKEEYDDENKFLDWFKNYFRLYKDDIHVSVYD